MKLPDRWLHYSNGKHIQGTRFVACKTPLRMFYKDDFQCKSEGIRTDVSMEYFRKLLPCCGYWRGILAFLQGRQELRRSVDEREHKLPGEHWALKRAFVGKEKARNSEEEFQKGQGFNRSLTADKSFTPSDLLLEYPQIQLVIDLTFTYRYYNGHLEFVKRGIQYVKIKCKGKQVPDSDVYNTFCSIIEKFLEDSPEDAYVAVHCTHGVNRTGYLIARYMIDKLGYSPKSAVEAFAAFRGHAIERENYVDDLMGMASSSSAAEAEWITVVRKRRRRQPRRPYRK